MRALLFLALVSVSLFAAGPDCSSDFKSGVSAYEAGRYEEARTSWRSCLDQGIRNSQVFHNLGNASYRLGEVGHSVYYYRKALLINPGSEESRFNLTQAEELRKDRQDELEVDAAFQALWTLHTALSIDTALWVLLTLLLILMVGVLLIRRSVTPGLKGVLVGVMTLVILLGTPLTLSTGYKIWQYEFLQEGVVLVESTDLWSGPGTQYQVLATLHSGTTLEVLAIEGEWASVEVGGSMVGYLSLSDIGLLQE